MKKYISILAALCFGISAVAENVVKTGIPYLESNGDKDIDKFCKVLVSHPENARNLPVLIFFHGGGLKRGSRHIPGPLKQAELVSVGAGYRLYPSVSIAQLLDDCAAAVAWTFNHAAEYGGNPESVYVSGSSGGAYIALMLLLDKHYLAKYGIDSDRIAGVLSMSGQVITHQAARDEKGINRLQPTIDEYAPLYHMRADASPILLLTGDAKAELLCRRQENAYFAVMMKAIGHKDITFYHFDGCSHNDMSTPCYPLMLRWIKEHEKNRKNL